MLYADPATMLRDATKCYELYALNTGAYTLSAATEVSRNLKLSKVKRTSSGGEVFLNTEYKIIEQFLFVIYNYSKITLSKSYIFT